MESDTPPEPKHSEPLPWGRSRRWAVRLGIGLAVSVGFLALGVWTLCFMPYGTPPFPRQVEVPAGMGFREIAALLQEKDLVRSRHALLALAALRGEQGRVRAGIYRFDVPLSASALLAKLTRGEVFFHRVTLPEGWSLMQVADRLTGEGLVDRDHFLRKACDSDVVRELLGFEAPSLEGFLFPDTYNFLSGTGEARILRTLVKRFQQALDPSLQARAEEMGWSVLQTVTLASLIEKETSLAAERFLISGVFHRRLRLGMKLETDPTVIYGLEGFQGDLRREDLANPHPYNTYVFVGLPPGPICNPGRDALVAALFPAEGEYLYFVSRNDGSHHFSKSLQEHLRAVERYQRRRP